MTIRDCISAALLDRERRADRAYRCACWPTSDGNPKTGELGAPLRFGNAGWRAHTAWRIYHGLRVGPARPDPVNRARSLWWSLQDCARAIQDRLTFRGR